MRAAPIIAGAFVAVLVVLLMNRRADAAPGEQNWTESMSSWLDNLTQDASANETRWRPLIAATESRYNLPTGLLSRLLYQESRYRTDIITGQTVSSVGALGIAQFMPATAADFRINPLDPAQAIPAAGKYLAQLYASTGDWRLALASYNFGIGNVTKGRAWPDETVAYVNDIATDVGLA